MNDLEVNDMLKYFRFFVSKLLCKESNMRSHITYIKLKFSKNIKAVDEVILDKNAHINASNGSIVIGDYLRLKENSMVSAISGNIKIGDCVFINRNCNVVCRKRIIIDDGVSIGPNVIIWDHDHRFDENRVYGTEYKTGDIIIEKGCWIGAGAIILRNTRIGEGSVIGAGTVVKGEIPPHSLVTMNRELIIRPIVK